MKRVAIAALMSAVAATPAVAADKGLYIGAKLGVVNYGYSNVYNNSQAGYGLVGGYALNDYFALEAEINNLGGFETLYSIIKGSSYGVSGVVTLPMDPYFSLFAKLGVTSSSLEDSPQNGASGGTHTYTNTGLSIGIGGQFNVNEAVGIRLGFDSYQVGDAAISATSKAGMVYIGGLYKF